jgi:hypothetical protein
MERGSGGEDEGETTVSGAGEVRAVGWLGRLVGRFSRWLGFGPFFLFLLSLYLKNINKYIFKYF